MDSQPAATDTRFQDINTEFPFTNSSPRDQSGEAIILSKIGQEIEIAQCNYTIRDQSGEAIILSKIDQEIETPQRNYIIQSIIKTNSEEYQYD